MTDDRIRLREEVAEQIKALKEIKIMGEQYGLDLSRPAQNAQEAVQWVYMAYLAAAYIASYAGMNYFVAQENFFYLMAGINGALHKFVTK
jgi:formate C-acetyltransferase